MDLKSISYSLLLATACSLPVWTMNPNDEWTEEASSTIFVRHNTEGMDNCLAPLITAMDEAGTPFYATSGKPNGLIKNDDVVLLKPNCQWDERGMTNTDLLKSVIQSLLAHPDGFKGEIIVTDNGQAQAGSTGKGGSFDWTKNNAADKSQSVSKVVNSFASNGKVQAVLLDSMTRTRVKEYSKGDNSNGFVVADSKAATGSAVSYPKFKTKGGTCVSFREGIWNAEGKRYEKDKLKVINMPVLKAHSIFQATGALKSYMGVVSDLLVNHDAHNSVGRGFMGTQMAGSRVPTLNVMDAIYVGSSKGPGTKYSQATKTGIVAISQDPCALDYWAMKNVLMPAAKKAGNSSASTMDPDGKSPGTVGYWLAISLSELNKAGHNFTMDEKSIKVIEVK